MHPAVKPLFLSHREHQFAGDPEEIKMNTVEDITYGDLHTAVDGLAHAITLLEQLPLHDKEHLDELRRVFDKLDTIIDVECCGGWDEWHEVESRVAAVVGKTRDHLFDRSILLSAVRVAAPKYRHVNKDEENPEV
jgi:hypothetical protein